MSENAGRESAREGQPLISICVPVYNKVQHVGKVLEGILGQAYERIEIVISDNGSDDGSSDVCSDFARRDRRVRHCRLEKTITLNENWRLVMGMAKGDFCKMQSADDPLHPEFVGTMLEPMLRDPAVAFTVCRETPRFIDVEGKVDVPYWTQFFVTSGDLCRELTMTAEKKAVARLLVEQNAFGNRLGNIYKVLFRPACLPTERWRQLSASYPMPQAFADWDFLVRLFLNHRGHFVDKALTYFDFDPLSPFVKLQTNPQMQLAAALQDYLIPLTVLTDPTLWELREWLSPPMRERILLQMGQSLRELTTKAAIMDARTRAGEKKKAVDESHEEVVDAMMTSSEKKRMHWKALLLSIALLVVAGVVDEVTGPQVVVFPLYMLPVAVMAWAVGTRAGCLMGGACTMVWLGVNLGTGQFKANEFTPYWNALMWFLGLAVVAFLTHARRDLGIKVERLVDERTVALQAEVSERKRSEEAIHRLAAQISEAEDVQRRQLAHDIHDTLGQTLTVIKMNLQAMVNGADEREARRLRDSLSLIETMIRQTRTMTFELYPAMLDDLGLVPTIRKYLEDYQVRTGLRVGVSESGEGWKLASHTANYLFRSVKELINNSSKHGRACEILVTVHWREEGLRVVVDDDGCGFDATQRLVPHVHQGLGLASIQERLLSLGGRSHLESEVGKGTRVILELPGRSSGDTQMMASLGKDRE